MSEFWLEVEVEEHFEDFAEGRVLVVHDLVMHCRGELFVNNGLLKLEELQEEVGEVAGRVKHEENLICAQELEFVHEVPE